MKLCHVITTLDPGGAENALKDLVVGLKEKDYQQNIVYLKGNGKLKSFFENIDVPVRKIFMDSLIDYFAAKKTLAKHLIGQDLVHSHLLKANSLASGACGEIPLVGSRHNDEALLKNSLVNYFHKRFSQKEKKHIAISQAVKNFYTGLGLSEKKFEVIPYGFEASIPKNKMDLHDHFKIPNGKPLLLHAGRMVEQKGQKDLIDAMALLPDFHLAICGEGPLEDDLKRQCYQLDIQDRVYFCGFVNNFNEWARAADLFVFPSHWEGLGRVLLECMAQQLPVVATETSAIPEVLGQWGWLCPPSNSKKLAETITQAFKDREDWPRRKEGMMAHLKNNFSMAAMVDSHDTLYRKLI